jgi:hypothetical protein
VIARDRVIAVIGEATLDGNYNLVNQKVITRLTAKREQNF